MKSRETKQRDLVALTEKLQGSKSAMVVSFTKATVNKDQELRSRLREAGAQYQVVKNTLARIAVKDTPFEGAGEYFKGVSALAWTDGDPVVLTKAISKFLKDNADVYTFKAGIVDGKVVNLAQVNTIASLPSKEELISKLLFVINAQAQRIVTVINAVPRNLAIVVKLIGESKPAVAEAAPAAKAEVSAEVKVEESASAPVDETPAADVKTAPAEAAVAEVHAEEAPAAEAAPEIEPAVAETPADETPAEENILEMPRADEASTADAEPEAEEKAE